MAQDDSSTPKPTQSSGMPADPPEPPGPEYKVNPRAGGEDDMNAVGKYLLIGVPQFAKDPISGNLMTSYLRLGASSTTWEQDPGGWLAAKIHEHGPPGGHLSPDGQPVNTTAEERSPDRVFLDDDRNRVDGVPHALDKSQRQAQSRILHTRGGWRDHSDGNRISTTYGDKVEVIRGNYKMMILGRQDDPTASAGWDAGGQIIQDYAYMMPGAAVRVEECSNYTDANGNNVWHLQNTMECMVSSTNFAGDFFEYKWGNKHWSFVGSETPVEKNEDGYPRQNPHILEKTWAEKIESYTGSMALPVPEVFEETWVTTKTSKETIGTTSSMTTIGASASIETIGAKSSVETVGASASLSVIGAEAALTVKGVGLDVTVEGIQADITLAGIHAEIEAALAHATIEYCPFRFDLFYGNTLSLQFGTRAEIDAVEKKEFRPKQFKAALAHTTVAAFYDVMAPLVRLGVL